MIILTPLTMIGRIVAYKHFWSDVTTALIMSIFILGICNIVTIKYYCVNSPDLQYVTAFHFTSQYFAINSATFMTTGLRALSSISP